MQENFPTQLSIRVINNNTEWERLRAAWSTLFEVSPHASTTLDFAWLSGWWRSYGSLYEGRGHGLRIITLWRGSRLIGGLPLYKRIFGVPFFGIRSLQFLSTGEAEHEETCPDYLGLLCEKGEEEECAKTIWRVLEQLSWDHLDLLDLPDNSPLLLSNNNSISYGSYQSRERGSCPIADLTGGFETYLQRLSANSRQQARRLLREGEKTGVIFELAEDRQFDEFFSDLVRLHQERWTTEGKPGCFAAPRFTKFHRALAGEWLQNRRSVLGRLSLKGQTVAVLYGFVTRRKFDFYQSGVIRSRSSPLRSPGNLAHLLLMRQLIERGIECYDFLRGSATYKERLATGENRLFRIQVWRRTIRSAMHRSVLLFGRSVKKGFKRLKKRG